VPNLILPKETRQRFYSLHRVDFRVVITILKYDTDGMAGRSAKGERGAITS
jgi:hypothetical protein